MGGRDSRHDALQEHEDEQRRLSGNGRARFLRQRAHADKFAMRDEDWLFAAVGVVLLSVTLLADMSLDVD